MDWDDDNVDSLPGGKKATTVVAQQPLLVLLE